jgi:hypothetical protein
MINKTGVVIAIYRDNVFETIEPDGKAATLIEFKTDPYTEDGIVYKDVEIQGIRDLPEKTDEDIIVNKDVALYGWSIGRYDLIYLDGSLVKDSKNQTVASQTLVRHRNQ